MTTGVRAPVRPPRAASRVEFDAIGTRWAITTAGALDPQTRQRIDATIAEYDAVWSRFRADSAVARLAPSGGSADLGPHAPALLGLLLELSAQTDGAMTPLIGRSLEHLGYDADYRLAAHPGFRPAPLLEVLHLDGTVVTLTEPALIDVGAAGKGQLVDLVGRLLADAGYAEHLVDAGGDLRASGAPVRVALEHPYDPTVAIGVLDVQDAALAASATNRRAWHSTDGRGRLHHVLDGRTGAPVAEVAATWVLATTAMVADALATALFFLNERSMNEPGMNEPGANEPGAQLSVADAREPASVFADRSDVLGWVRMYTDGRVEASGALSGELFE